MQNETQFQVYNASAGSGKTFTLVKEYLKILLLTDDIFRFQNILAITFTNKAAAEMKERVLDSLKDFSEGKNNDLSAVILDEISLSNSDLQQRSKRVLNSILQNYSAFNISTIDSFTYRIIRSFAFDLGLSLNFEVEMDVNLLLDEAVDLLISKIGEDKNLTQVLIDFSLDKTDDDKSWDIAKDLKEFARILLNENDINELKKIESKTVQDFTDLKKHLRKQQKIIENKFVEIGENGLEIINSMNLEYNDFYRSMFPNHFKNLVQDLAKTKFFDQSKLRERIEENSFYAKSKPEDIKIAIEEILPPLLELYTESEKLYQQYTLNGLVLKSLIPLAVLKHINNSLNELKVQNNIRLNAEFNQLISEQIRNEPAPFIYERIGEKFRYYFIDEMQDTSQLQWQNLIPLIDNALTSETLDSERGSLMLVGDAKQAIYRWRGGKSEQFIDLSNKENPFSVSKEVNNLETNYRSYSQIIDFNNQFFTHVSDFLGSESYQDLYVTGNQQKINNKDGGFVQISFVEKDKDDDEKELVFSKKALEVIQNLDSEFQWRDVCVLVRKKKEGVAIANYLSENNIDIVSSETLLLKNNELVGFVINLLTFLYFSDNKEAAADTLYFLSKKIDAKKSTHIFIDELIHKSNREIFESLKKYNFVFDEDAFIQLSFYEGIEYIIRSFKLIEKTNAFVLSFLDIVLEYQQKKGHSLGGFLEYWERKKESLSINIPEGQNAIQIMTIHKSKGLEFPVVIYPYDLDIYREIKPKIWYKNLNEKEYLNFDTSLVDYSKKLNYTGNYGEILYSNRREKIQLDNLNLLYVALTRPIEQLYIITEKKSTQNDLESAKYYSDLFIDYLKVQKENTIWSEEKTTYNIGSPKRVIIGKEQRKTKIKSIYQEKFISSSRKEQNITIVTNSSLLWDTEQEKAIQYGNLIHEILSKIKTINDVENTLQEYVLEGLLDRDKELEVKKSILQVVNHPKLKRFFEPNLLIFNEQEMISKNKLIQIPDRIIIKDNKTTIIDYKTGIPKEEYLYQINAYASTLKDMNFSVSNKFLVYINTKIDVVKVA